jgi:hypothetical protein
MIELILSRSGTFQQHCIYKMYIFNAEVNLLAQVCDLKVVDNCLFQVIVDRLRAIRMAQWFSIPSDS